MADNFKLFIDDVDFSAYIQQETDIKETMRRLVGNAQAPAIDGTTIPDLIAIKWDPSFLLKPMPRTMMETLLEKMEQETVELQYTSVRREDGDLRVITAMPVSMTVKFATKWNDERVYAETPISFEEV